jgi:eukaryotic-like serine/threonine-protein kinase
MVGKTIGHYEIVGKLGQGGMGVVYRATDRRLERDVALKFLPDAIAGDKNALERLKREARAGALSHPNICAVYDIGEADGHPFICMELLEGETLADRLQRGPLPMPDVLTFGMQIAAALAAAHAKGVIHRDIKPSNIFLTRFDQVKLLDFGVARKAPIAEKAMAGTAATASLADPLTTPGMAVGTLVYMSPEQARGEEIDARSDLFSFGAVLYEMATGKRPFQGNSAALIYDAILHANPILPSRVNPALPGELDAVVSKALEKDPDTRYQSAVEIGADLKRIKRATESGTTPVAPLPRRRRLKASWYAVVAALIVIAAGAYVWWGRSRTLMPAPQSEWVQLTDFTNSAVEPALSPDGRMLAFFSGSSPFLTDGDLYVKLLPNGEPIQLTHDGSTKVTPAFSPDGSQVAYTVAGRGWDTWAVSVLGGQPRLVLPNATALSWIDNDRFLFSEILSGMHMGLVTATATRGDHRTVYIPPRERGMVHRAALSPDKRWVLLVEMDNGGFIPCRLVPLDGSTAGHQVGPAKGGCTYGAWSPDEKWMYFGSDASGSFHLWRQRFNGQDPVGEAEQLTFGPTEEEGLAVAPDGRSLITSVGIEQQSIWMHDHSGDHELTSEASASAPRFSPDGSAVYYLSRSRAASSRFESGELWRRDLATGNAEAVLPGVIMNSYDVSPDSKRVAFSINEKGKAVLYLAPLDRRTPPQRVESDLPLDLPVFMPNGDVAVRAAKGTLNYPFRVSADGKHVEQLVDAPMFEHLAVSPDGRWVAARAGNDDPITPWAIVAYPVGGGKPVKLCLGPCEAEWSTDGKSLVVRFFLNMKSEGTAVIPLPPAKMFPDLPAPIDSTASATKIHGAIVIPRQVTVGRDGRYLFVRATVERNLYRIPLR